MKKIEYLVVHGSGHSPNATGVGAVQLNRTYSVLGDGSLPFHVVIKVDGTLERGIQESIPGRHLAGYEDRSLAVCMIGGRHGNELYKGMRKLWPGYTEAQMKSLRAILSHWSKLYIGSKIVGANDLDRSNPMPGFDVGSWWRGSPVGSTFKTPLPYGVESTDRLPFLPG